MKALADPECRLSILCLKMTRKGFVGSGRLNARLVGRGPFKHVQARRGKCCVARPLRNLAQ